MTTPFSSSALALLQASFLAPEIVWLHEHHPDLLARALHIKQNAQPNLTSVKGLGRSFAWSDYLQRCIELPLFGDGHG